jgi:EmrB/QacA subfamily drug resistance transporter
MELNKVKAVLLKTVNRFTGARNRLSNKASPAVVMTVICIGIFVAALDQTVIYGALPGMMNTIGLSITHFDQASWIVIGYLLGYTFAMPLIGRVSDAYGHSRVYILSLCIFAVGSVLVAVSASVAWVIGARILQAVGGGALVPVAMAITGDLYQGKNRAVALGIIGAAVEAGGALGPFYGAVIAQFMSWQWIFWINIPVSLIVLVIVWLNVRSAKRAGGKIDVLSSIALAAALTFLCLGLSRQSDQPHYLALMLVFLAAAAVFFAFFILRALKTSEPLIKLSVFKNMLFSAGNLTNLFVGAALIIAMVNIPLMSDTILGASPLEGGFRLLRFTVMLSIGALAGGFLCKRFGYRLPTIAGLILSTFGFFFMSRWTLSIADPDLTIHLFVAGFGFGLVIAPLGTAVMDAVPEDQNGLASSMVVMARMIGMMIGMAAITASGMERFHMATSALTLEEMIKNPEKLSTPMLAMFNNFFFASVFICAAAIVPALFLRRRKKKPDSERN